jgi:lipopolysaccharide export LptBFGC system permease protein LptF
MVFTIHRYIFRDLLKTFGLATLVLSTVLGLGLMLRPLQQYSVDPVHVPSLILCTLPITLTMVVPIAALMAATINYGRLAADNEISACKSSGIGLWTLVYPALALALLVGIATLLLAFHVIPSYTEKFDAIITADAEAIIYRNIEKQGNLDRLFKGYRIHADRAYPEKHCLTGVVLYKMDRKRVEQIYAAERAWLKLQTTEEMNQILLHLQSPTVIIGNSSVTTVDTTLSIDVPKILQDDIKFKNLTDLKAIQEDMTLFSPVREQLGDIRRQLLVEKYFEWCDQIFARQGYLEVIQVGHRLRIYADGCELYGLKKQDKKQSRRNRMGILNSRSGQPVRVDYYYDVNDKKPERQFIAQQGSLYVDPESQRKMAILTLREVESVYLDQSYKITHQAFPFTDIKLPDEILDMAGQLDLYEVLDPAAAIPLQRVEPSLYLRKLYSTIQEDCGELLSEIRAEKHSRLAFGVSCVALVLLGVALGIVFRSGHLLTAFGVSFIPAALCLITIFTGKHIAEQNEVTMNTGITFLWSGIFAVMLVNVILYRNLLKR